MYRVAFSHVMLGLAGRHEQRPVKDQTMTDTVLLFLLVSVLAFLVGFAIRRGSICTVAAFLKPSRGKFDLIVPVPPSGARRVQPVVILAKGIGEALNLPVAECVTRGTFAARHR
jgi:hypothetical protein